MKLMKKVVSLLNEKVIFSLNFQIPTKLIFSRNFFCKLVYYIIKRNIEIMPKSYVSYKMKRYEFNYKLNTETGVFTINLPDYLKTSLTNITYGKIQDKSFENLKNEFFKLIVQYIDTKRVVKTIIAYQIRIDKPHHRVEDDRNWTGGKSEIPGGLQYGIQLQWKVLKESDLDGHKSYYFRDATGEDIAGVSTVINHRWWPGDIEDYKVIDYTPELEKWFENLEEGLWQLLIKVDEFFGENTEHLLDNIQKQGYLLTTSK